MSHEQASWAQLQKELDALREEVAELRSIEAMHRQARAGLQAIELQLAGIIHSAMDAVITVDEAQRILLFNAAAESMFGYAASDMLGQPLDRLIPERHRLAHRTHIRTFGETKVTNRRMGALGAVTGLRKSGEEFPLEASISQVETTDGHLFTVILRDITERLQAEERISQLGRILDESLSEIFLFDADTLHFLQVNRGARENLGYSLEELQRLTPLDVKPEFTRSAFEDLIRPLKTGERSRLDFRTIHRRKNGSTYPVEVHLQLMHQGSSRFFVAIILDLTQRLKAEEELQETQRTLTTLIGNLPGMVYRRHNTPDWPMEFVSPGCRLLTGYAPETLLTRQISYGRNLIVPEDQERVWQEVQTALKAHKPFQLSYVIKTKDGTKKWIWEQGSGVFSPSGDVIALEGYIMDVTEQRALQEQLRKTERLAELGTLASGMAHEIGTPMNVILGRAEYLIRKTTDDNVKRGLETIVSQVERITKIMNQLLSFARKRPVERRHIRLSPVINDILDVMRERLKKYHIQTELALDSSDPEVFADPDQMSQVLLNLVVNACQAMQGGGRLRIALTRRGDRVELLVSDTGHGISKEHLSRLFDPFFTTKAVGEGTGLGLTVVHGIIQEHEGSITVESEPQKGTTFRILLPASFG